MSGVLYIVIFSVDFGGFFTPFSLALTRMLARFFFFLRLIQGLAILPSSDFGLSVSLRCFRLIKFNGF